MPLSPDCRDGNHQKCDGVAWDEEKDDFTTCKCPECKGKLFHRGPYGEES